MWDETSKVSVFTEMMSCIKNLFVWHYSPDLKPVGTSCPDPEYWEPVFSQGNAGKQALEHCRDSRFPVLVGNELHLLWIAAPHCCGETEKDTLTDIYVLGPVFFSVQAESLIRQAVTKAEIPVRFRRELVSRLRDLPVITQTSFLQFGTMLHCCLSGRRISISDIAVVPVDPGYNALRKDAVSKKGARKNGISSVETDTGESPHGGGAYEALLLNLIEEGNLNYKNILESASFSHGIVGEMASGNSLRQSKNEVITAVTLFSRAAIRGGLSRDLALTISDYYIQSVESAQSIPETFLIMQTMQEDYIRRVHRHRQTKEFSAPVRACLDLIESNVESPLTIRELAEKSGYSGYYISSLFRKETGSGIGDYIRQQKVERAKLLLADTRRPVSDIAASLSFSTPSRFTAVFHKLTGMTPREYREQLTLR